MWEVARARREVVLMAFSCGVGAPGGGGGGVRIVVRCFMERREREAWWIRRVVRAPGGRVRSVRDCSVGIGI